MREADRVCDRERGPEIQIFSTILLHMDYWQHETFMNIIAYSGESH